MQDKIIASHTCFGGHMDINCKPVYKLLNVSDDLKCDTIFTYFQGITNNIYGLKTFFLLFYLFTRPPIFLPIRICFTRPNDGWTGLYIKL